MDFFINHFDKKFGKTSVSCPTHPPHPRMERKTERKKKQSWKLYSPNFTHHHHFQSFLLFLLRNQIGFKTLKLWWTDYRHTRLWKLDFSELIRSFQLCVEIRSSSYSPETVPYFCQKNTECWRLCGETRRVSGVTSASSVEFQEESDEELLHAWHH